MTQESVALEIGVGERKKNSHALGLDIRRTADVDILCDARCLPFRDSSAGSLYSAHTLEHFSHRDTGAVIREWVRVLKPGGSIEVRCPDLRIRALLFFLNPVTGNIRNIYGGQDYPENFHKSGFSYGLLKLAMERCGIVEIRRVFDGYRGIPLLPSDLHVIGKKKEERSAEGRNT